MKDVDWYFEFQKRWGSDSYATVKVGKLLDILNENEDLKEEIEKLKQKLDKIDPEN